jgi:hypothetical protein
VILVTIGKFRKLPACKSGAGGAAKSRQGHQMAMERMRDAKELIQRVMAGLIEQRQSSRIPLNLAFHVVQDIKKSLQHTHCQLWQCPSIKVLP